jgi:hypothetical protein
MIPVMFKRYVHTAILVMAVFFVSCQGTDSTKQQELESNPQPQADTSSVLTTILPPGVSPQDTLHLLGTVYHLVPIQESYYNQWPKQEFTALENSRLVQSTKVVRNDDGLHLLLEDGSTKSLVDNREDGDQFAEYTYQGFMSEWKQHIVYQLGYESFRVLLIELLQLREVCLKWLPIKSASSVQTPI